ncbi:hypothetical protein H8E77_34305 [bacterium]|nr:hypothetical protein [bacterium]
MRYNLHSILWMLLICAVIGMLAFDIPMAKAEDVDFGDITEKLKLGLSIGDIGDIYAVPGSTVQVELTIGDGSYDAADDEVTGVQFMIEYESSVVMVEDPVSDVVVHVEDFGIAEGWTVGASTEPGAFEQLKIVAGRVSGNYLQEPEAWPDPAVFATITFTVMTYHQADFTELVFMDGDDETYFGTAAFDSLVILEAPPGNISFQETGSTEIELLLPSVTVDPQPGLPVPIPLKVMGGYIYEDLIDAVIVTVAYDSDVVEIVDPDADVVAHLDRFLAPEDVPGWNVIARIKTDIPVPPEHLEKLDKQLQVQMLNIDNSQYGPLNAVYPEDLLTITFTVQSSEPTDKTRLLFINTLYSYFQKRDDAINFGKLLVGPLAEGPGDIHGDVALPVELSHLGAIWNPNGAKIFWEAISQRGNLGWNIYRSETKDGKFVKINGELIKGAGTTANPMKYSFIDKDAKKGKIYYYYLEDISFNGEKHRTDAIKSIPVNKITSWGDIKRSALR